MRLPAAWTGVATLKPSNGRIPLDNPYFGRSAGPLARTVADVALGMHIADWEHPGSDMTGRRALEAYETFGDLQKRTVAATSGYDAVLAPVAPVAAFPAEWPMPWGFDAGLAMPHIAFTLLYNMSGQPASSVNCGFTANGRPIGLQISGRRFADLETLRLTAWYEGARSVDVVPVFPS
ncbi:amidase family protein [Microbacterium proteolyticum]|uniref:amidase family protein n=1 Tax=Microbacterium proteolyticum TaxID=1572644 RepID=UPI001FAD5F39|nr:amidase family protein [Microbacterium proteolyticum]MCI9857867.1 hypothetical protein [Microbacterium proteolyticum]